MFQIYYQQGNHTYFKSAFLDSTLYPYNQEQSQTFGENYLPKAAGSKVLT